MMCRPITVSTRAELSEICS